MWDGGRGAMTLAGIALLGSPWLCFYDSWGRESPVFLPKPSCLVVSVFLKLRSTPKSKEEAPVELLTLQSTKTYFQGMPFFPVPRLKWKLFQRALCVALIPFPILDPLPFDKFPFIPKKGLQLLQRVKTFGADLGFFHIWLRNSSVSWRRRKNNWKYSTLHKQRSKNISNAAGIRFEF